MDFTYYVKTARCHVCGQVIQTKNYKNNRLVIGRKVPGRRFLFAEHTELDLSNTVRWLSYLQDRTIVNESGHEVSYEDFLTRIITAQSDSSYEHFRHEPVFMVDPYGFTFCTTPEYWKPYE